MAQQSQVCGWDFTQSVIHWEGGHIELMKILDKHCKKWAFQEEKSEQGYQHYQGRISLKMKQRLSGVRRILERAHWSVTSNANKGNMFYVLKEESRVAGPWTNEMDLIPKYVPRQIRNIELYPWQQRIIDLSKEWDTRSIHLIFDVRGNIGKSTLVTYMGVHKLAHQIPFCNDYKEILQAVMDRPTRTCYLIDMPRAVKKEKQFQLWGAVETIKSGYCFDKRYSFKERYFDCPQVFAFTNFLPDKRLLTGDRWKVWQVQNQQLMEYEIPDEEEKQEIEQFLEDEEEEDDLNDIGVPPPLIRQNAQIWDDEGNNLFYDLD
jgi:hypothetical protein